MLVVGMPCELSTTAGEELVRIGRKRVWGRLSPAGVGTVIESSVHVEDVECVEEVEEESWLSMERSLGRSVTGT